MKTIKYILLSLALVLFNCTEEYLDEKPDKALVVPTTLEDFQALLDNYSVMNISPALGMMASDESFTPYSAWLETYTATEKNCYIWGKEIYEGMLPEDWALPYRQIFYANIVLEGIEKVKVTPANERQWNSIKGTALFLRGYALFQLAELFTAPYVQANAAQQMGLPIRTSADVNQKVGRASQQQTYEQIARDLKESVALLPNEVIKKSRPVAAAANAALARLYLYTADYKQAHQYASDALALDNTLIDYNTLDVSSSRTMELMNDEVLFHAELISYGYCEDQTTYVDTLLYTKYANDDIRLDAYFQYEDENRYSFKGNYSGRFTQFGGLAIDEVYLIRAESRARLGDMTGARQDLNALLSNRWKAGTFTAINETDPDKLLAIIIEERKKELLFRNIYWSDRRRLNSDPKFQQVMRRNLNGKEYSLPPEDTRYAFPIPVEEIQTSGIEQNP